ncbi:unnamed protein product [Alternaria burnsii]|nr:unnamed protein product [Alternaria burnsii]
MKQKTLEWAGPYGAWCSVCSPETEETHTNLPFGLVTLPSEPAMNAAGRTSDHPFKDLRSARRTYQRSKIYPERIYSGNKRRRSDKSLLARVAASSKDPYKQIEIQEWEGDWDADWAHEIDMERIDDIAAYYLFGKNADIFECYNDGDIMAGEDFGSWARRRIAEMRQVKEHRIHRYGKPTSSSPLSVLTHTMRNDSRPGRTSATILTAPHANSHETTLPTSLSDIRAHLTLACALAPSENLKQRCCSRNLPALPIIYGFNWWGEYTWQWHRNMSGCWYLGYGHACQENCEEPCTRPCWGHMLYECYCEEFGVGTDWEVPAPEDVQRCSIVEWVSGKLREDMENDHDEVVWWRLQGTVKEDEQDSEADLGQQREYGNYFEDEYVILGKKDEDSDAWSLISSVDGRSCS